MGYWRRNYLTPVPRVDSLDELNDAFAGFEEAEENRRIGMRIRTIGQDFAREAPLLLPLPEDPFETGLALSLRRVEHLTHTQERVLRCIRQAIADRGAQAGSATLPWGRPGSGTPGAVTVPGEWHRHASGQAALLTRLAGHLAEPDVAFLGVAARHVEGPVLGQVVTGP